MNKQFALILVMISLLAIYVNFQHYIGFVEQYKLLSDKNSILKYDDVFNTNFGSNWEIAKYYINLKKVPAVGDSARDLEAYYKSDAQPILVRTGNGKTVEKNKTYPKNTLIFDNLLEASKFIVKSE